MTRITIVIIAAALLGLAALPVAHAQPSAQLSPPAEPATGSISGRIVFVGRQPECGEDPLNLACLVHLVPTNIGQPIDILANLDLMLEYLVRVDAEGNFSFTGVADGEYFILLVQGSIEGGTPSPETVAFASGDFATRLAVRVTVANGQAVTGIELTVRAPEPIPTSTPGPPAQLSPPNHLSPPGGLSVVNAPTTGTGPAPANGGAGYITAGLAVVAALLLAGGVAMRVRGSRRA